MAQGIFSRIFLSVCSFDGIDKQAHDLGFELIPVALERTPGGIAMAASAKATSDTRGGRDVLARAVE